MVITLRDDRTRQNEQLSSYNVGSESKWRAARRYFFWIIHDYLIGPFFLPDHLNGQNYLSFLQQVLPDLPRKYFLWGQLKSSVNETPIESLEKRVALISIKAADVRGHQDLPTCMRFIVHCSWWSLI
ncbi:hypothetical protein AVEN_214112-1 [Araneus ventricosus]|uniref:Uncharacterized protein n=1 Tax=Araneus ventricosus TaxID=182803 RepID=A0A4Y2C8F2_ARAVE|nr:hypothetical protein AVEN_214112-1 [Araneus ventricosus]